MLDSMFYHYQFVNLMTDSSMYSFILCSNFFNKKHYNVCMYSIAYYTSKSGIWLVISRVASYFHEPEASTNTAYE